MKPFPITADFAWNLIFAQGAGLELAGESGSGKSQALLAILKALLKHVYFAVLIDPDNDTAEALFRYCASIKELAERTYYFQLNDPQFCGGFNSLEVIDDPNPIIVEARRSAKVEHDTHVQLAAWGETNTDSRPTLAKNLARTAYAASRCNMAPLDRMLFFDTQSEIYPHLCLAVDNPIQRREMLDLPKLKPAERAAQIESARNRLLTTYANPIVRAIHARTNVSGAYSFAAGYERGDIVICNAHRGTTLRLADQQMSINQFVAEYFAVVTSRSPQQRRPSLLAIDELPVLEGSFHLLETNLPRIRKFQSRVVVCHQGVHTFEGGVESRLLNLVRSTCKTRLFFRSSNPADAKFSTEQMLLPSINLKQVKHVQYDYEQYQAGTKIVTLEDRSSGTSSSQEQGGGNAQAESHSVTDTRSRSDREAADRVQAIVTDAQSQASSGGTTRTRNDSWSKSRGRSTSVTTKQTIQPVYKWRKVLRDLRYWTAEELFLKGASRLARLPVGACLLFTSGHPVVEYQFPLLPDPFARCPRFGARKLDELRADLLARPEYMSLDEVEAYRRRFLELLIHKLKRLSPIDGGLIVPPPLFGGHSDDESSPLADEEPPHGPWTI